MNRLTCAFTGHRPKSFPWKYDEVDPRCMALRVALSKQLKKLAERGVTDFLCGMAQGADLWCAATVLGLRWDNQALKLHCILPCKGQANTWPESYYKHYYSILEQADSIVFVNREYHEGCMLERNRFMVERAPILLAVYNGTRRSGTGAAVNYARKLGREIITIDPVELTASHENLPLG